MGYPKETQIYVASGQVYGGQNRMAPLRNMFPNLVNYPWPLYNFTFQLRNVRGLSKLFMFPHCLKYLMLVDMNNLAGGLIYTKYKSMFGSDFEMVKIK